MKKTRILFTIGHIGTGGKERQLLEIIKTLNNDWYEISLIHNGGDAFNANKIQTSISHSFKIGHFNFIKFLNTVSAINPHIIYCFSRPTSYFSLAAQFICKNKFKLINGSIQSAPVRKSLAHLLYSALYNLFDNVVANSYAGLSAFNQLNKKNRYVLYNGFDFSRAPSISKHQAQEELNISTERFNICMVAGLKPTKDFITYLKAAKICFEEKLIINFYIAGSGPDEEKLRKFAIENQIQNVIFLGNVAQVEKLFLACDVSVLCSTNGEGISNSILESLAVETPVIATMGGGTNEIIQDKYNGLLINPYDPENLVLKIKSLYYNRTLLEQYSKNCKSSISKFDIQKMSETFLNIISTAV